MRFNQPKLSTLIKIVILILLVPCAMLGCAESGSEGIGNEPPLFNITGRFVTDGSESCIDQSGNPIYVPPTDALIQQEGNSLTMIVERSGQRHNGSISGDAFFVKSTIEVLGERCNYEFSGTIFSDNHLAGVEMAECTNGASMICPGTVLHRAL
jgi:hypothetical protein